MSHSVQAYKPLSDYNKVSRKLNEHNIRPTNQRMTLAKLLFEKGKRHISAEELYSEVKEDHRKYLSQLCIIH